MNINKKALALIIGGLAVIAFIIYFVFIYDYNKTPAPADSQTAQPQTTVEPIVTESPKPASSVTPATKAELGREDVRRLAISFTERYGSSSNQSEFNNLSDLEVFMTPAMIERTRAYVSGELAKPADLRTYTGITTHGVVADVALTDGTETALAAVKTKRQETTADGKSKGYEQTLTLGLKKIDGSWKVDSAVWSE